MMTQKEFEKSFGVEYVKADILSSHDEGMKEMSILNRILRSTEEGIEMEADLRHA